MGSINRETLIPDHDSQQVSVIIVPFPAQGHLNQMLQLSCLISSYNIPVHYVGSATHNRQARTRANGLNPSDVAKIHFQDLPIPRFPSPPPNPNSTNRFPAQLQPAWDATMSLRGPIAGLMVKLSSTHKRVIVIHDPLIASVVQDVATIPNAESYAFNCLSGFWRAPQGAAPDIHLHIWTARVFHRASEPGPGVQSRRSLQHVQVDGGPVPGYPGEPGGWRETGRAGRSGRCFPPNSLPPRRHECLKWLDRQEPRSVIYVTFGTTCSLTDEEINELATGLERSGHKFLWVLRDADKGDVFDGEIRNAELPPGFEERVGERGMVVRDWAPQPEILAHKSTVGL
ncbi:zeatin o-glucosyltransferase [Phtheirospermum japonicum]|uniref:Zeatin o-glucosyltransferase n=1 Tax=Phtheirospermum japonicum TaxID=374723 RepID=A0A830C3W5_9LAMI|nr:zeatin o-glucosyltransferase [Phtheirospermum japonicum]